MDTGERYVRLKPKGSTQIPDYVTVGGCKVLKLMHKASTSLSVVSLFLHSV